MWYGRGRSNQGGTAHGNPIAFEPGPRSPTGRDPPSRTCHDRAGGGDRNSEGGIAGALGQNRAGCGRGGLRGGDGAASGPAWQAQSRATGVPTWPGESSANSGRPPHRNPETEGTDQGRRGGGVGELSALQQPGSAHTSRPGPDAGGALQPPLSSWAGTH